MSQKHLPWNQIARIDQKIPTGKWRYWLLLAGRGFGKTRAASEAIVDFILKDKNQYLLIGCIGATYQSIEDIMFYGPSGILQCLNNRSIAYKYTQSKYKIHLYNTTITGYSAQNYNTVRGMEFDIIWIDEFAKYRYPNKTFEQANLCLRRKNSKMIITTTPKNLPILTKIQQDEQTVTTKGTTYHNNHLTGDYFRAINKLLHEEYAQEEIYAKNSKGYFWKQGDFIYKRPKNIVCYHLGIDPAVGPGITGLVLSCTDNQKCLFVLSCLSTRGSKWIDLVKVISNTYYPITIDYEINQGGNLLTQMLKQINVTGKLRPMRVSTAKKQRHYMLSMYYKLGKIFHIKPIITLEKSMLSGKEVDHIDALFATIYYH